MQRKHFGEWTYKLNNTAYDLLHKNTVYATVPTVSDAREHTQLQYIHELEISQGLTALWHSAESLFRRFNILPPEPKAAMEKVRQEFEEVRDEHINLFMDSVDASVSNLVHESVGEIVTLLGLAMAHGATYANFREAIEEVVKKNAAKNAQTHTVANGMIVKRKMN